MLLSALRTIIRVIGIVAVWGARLLLAALAIFGLVRNRNDGR